MSPVGRVRLGIHLIGPRILVGLVDQDASNSPRRHRRGELGANGVRLALHVVGELECLAGARVVDLDVGALAPAARGVHQLGGAGAGLLGEKADTELLGSRLEQRVFRVRVLAEQSLESRRRPERPVGILTAGERAVPAALGANVGRTRYDDRERESCECAHGSDPHDSSAWKAG